MIDPTKEKRISVELLNSVHQQARKDGSKEIVKAEITSIEEALLIYFRACTAGGQIDAIHAIVSRHDAEQEQEKQHLAEISSPAEQGRVINLADYRKQKEA